MVSAVQHILSSVDSEVVARPRETPVLICGGGISGLALAFWLKQSRIDAIVIDGGQAPGGVISSVSKAGFVFERGPSTVLDKYRSFDDLVNLAGLDQEILRVPLATQTRYVWLNNRLNPVPSSPGAFLRSPLLSVSGKAALLFEPFIGRGPEEESVADFVHRRLGPEWVRNLITPMVSGIWAGDPQRLSITQAFPILKELERSGGLIRGAIKRKFAKPGNLPQTKRKKNMVSFRGGLQQLPQALAGALGTSYHGGERVLAIQPQSDGGFDVVTDSAENGFNYGANHWHARQLVLATEGNSAAKLAGSFDSQLADTLDSFPYCRLAVVSLGIKSANARVPEGFGFLVPRGEGLRILGAIFHSNFFPGRAPNRHTALSVFIGGDLDPEAASLNENELVELTRRDLVRAIDLHGDPVAVHVERWERAIPQYDMQHAQRVYEISAAERRWPGLHLAGNWRDGVAIAERVEVMRQLAQQIAAEAIAAETTASGQCHGS